MSCNVVIMVKDQNVFAVIKHCHRRSYDNMPNGVHNIPILFGERLFTR